jgi:hypothetical protein
MSSQASHFKQDGQQRFRRAYAVLARSLANVGYIFPGSVTKRFIPCGKSSCRCATDPKQRHGPYYEWTRKVRGKTATIRLTAEQARLYQEWIKNRRGLKKILARMQDLSIRAAQAQIGSMSRR